jgi:hypothetical protein
VQRTPGTVVEFCRYDEATPRSYCVFSSASRAVFRFGGPSFPLGCGAPLDWHRTAAKAPPGRRVGADLAAVDQDGNSRQRLTAERGHRYRC